AALRGGTWHAAAIARGDRARHGPVRLRVTDASRAKRDGVYFGRHAQLKKCGICNAERTDRRRMYLRGLLRVLSELHSSSRQNRGNSWTASHHAAQHASLSQSYAASSRQNRHWNVRPISKELCRELQNARCRFWADMRWSASGSGSPLPDAKIRRQSRH